MQSSKEDSISDDTTRQLHQYVSRVKVQPETRLEYMKFDELMAYAQIEGRAMGMEEGRAEGRAEARRSMIFELLEEHGEIPEALHEKIKNVTSEDVLKDWLKIAAKIQSIEDFIAGVE